MRFLPHWRKATWAVVIWTILMAVWIAAGASSASNNCAGKTGSDLSACQAGTAIGGGIAVTFLVLLWFIGFVVLSLIWLMSRPDRRLCPVCGEQVKKGLTVCPKCGYNFAAALSQAAPAQVPHCSRCHAPVAVGQSPCPNCGAPIGWPTQQTPPPQA
jgi:RNA polymerase subunit RPABC4/transcription elongation factor Spt4